MPIDRKHTSSAQHIAGRVFVDAVKNDPVKEPQIRFAAFLAAIFALYVGVAMFLPAMVDFYVGNADWEVFAASGAIVSGLALAIVIGNWGAPPRLTPRFGFLLVNLIWVTSVLVGAIPFMLSSTSLTVTDAVFESVSALTTTGSTVITGLDGLPPGLLLWRSLLQWMGGLGVVALGLFVMPLLRVGGVGFFKIESSATGDIPFARFSSFSIGLIAVYIGLTAACAIAYKLAGMNGFDAVNHAMTTLATGGFSTHDASFGYFASNAAILWVGTIFMFLGGLPFSAMMLLFVQRHHRALRDPQIPVYAMYTAVFVAAVTVYLIASGAAFGGSFNHAAFNIVSLITTTGFASTDYGLWGPFALACIFVVTFLGGCSGSTAGGIKAYRFIILFEMMNVGFRQLVYPHGISKVRYGSESLDESMQNSSVLFIAAFFVSWGVFIVLLSATGLDIVTALTGALTALTNVGPGLGEVIGPAGNFAALPDSAKWILDVAMLLGRLEILAVLVLVSSAFWH